MVKTMTPREVEFLNRFMQKMTQVHQNPNQSIGICIEQLAKDKPRDIALYFQNDSWTWQNFNTESNKIANYFLNLGLKHYDTVAIMLENSPEYLFLATGINKIQGITALINIHQKRQALTHALNIVEPKWIVVDGDSLPSLNEIVEILPYKNEQIFVVNNPKNIYHDYIELPSELKSISKTNPNTTHNSVVRETVYYMFTSGTTGLPKAVIMQGFKLYTQGYILGFALAQVDSHDIVYIAMPLYHNVPIGIAWMTAILAGAATALRKRFSAS
ncbi:MAG: AMP-binding protein, partial [Candidatus Lokiarchaeota archaeon]|nr:AMP-binding protein [Candidatus Lokiarchaeota archaeon]